MKEYTIIVNHKDDQWALHCLAGRDKATAQKRLIEEQQKHPELKLAIEEYSEQESKELWWNKWGTN